MAIDFDSLSEFEREELSNIASDKYYPNEKFSLSDIVGLGENVCWLFLVLDGVRPACEFTMILRGDGLRPSELPFADVLYSLPVRFNMDMTNCIDEDGDTYLRIDWEVYGDERGDEWFDDLLTEDFEGEDVDRVFGERMGYPKSVIDAFVADECLLTGDVIREFSLSKEELRYLEFLPYMVPNDEEEVLDAISVARKWDARLRALADEYEFLSGLEMWADLTLEQGEGKVERVRSES